MIRLIACLADVHSQKFANVHSQKEKIKVALYLTHPRKRLAEVLYSTLQNPLEDFCMHE
jgi:hypothetical protein